MSRPLLALLIATAVLALLVLLAAAVGAALGVGAWVGVLGLYLIAVPAASIALAHRSEKR